MTFFMKIIDSLNPEIVSDYTAWYIQRLMMEYSDAQKNHMWRMVEG